MIIPPGVIAEVMPPEVTDEFIPPEFEDVILPEVMRGHKPLDYLSTYILNLQVTGLNSWDVMWLFMRSLQLKYVAQFYV